MSDPEKFEALAHILWDKQEQEFVYVFSRVEETKEKIVKTNY